MAATTPHSDVEHATKTHAIILTRQFVEDYAAYFEDVGEVECPSLPAIQKVRDDFLTFFGDVPTAIDEKEHSELLYQFTELGDKYVTNFLTNLGKFVQPFKARLDARDESVWSTLTQLRDDYVAAKEEAGEDVETMDYNIVRTMDIDGCWALCDQPSRDFIWEKISQLTSYGNIFTMARKVPSSILQTMQNEVTALLQEKIAAGMEPTQANIQQAYSEVLPSLVPKLMAQHSPEEMMAMMQDVIQDNPNFFQDMQNMGNTVDGMSPNININAMMKQYLPPGMDMAQVQSMMQMAFGAGGGAKR